MKEIEKEREKMIEKERKIREKEEKRKQKEREKPFAVYFVNYIGGHPKYPKGREHKFVYLKNI